MIAEPAPTCGQAMAPKHAAQAGSLLGSAYSTMAPHPVLHVGGVSIGNHLPVVLIAGPCQMESYDHAMEMAHALTEITAKYQMGFVYKTSFDKANRTSIHTKRGVGLEQALGVFEAIRTRYGCPVLTDVHDAVQCQPVAEVVDILQIPALLCRQTDLLVAAARTNRVINIKKGQFLAPWDMAHAVEKI